MILQEALPYVCAISGLGMTCNRGSPLSFYSGITLMLFACLIWMKRLQYRQDHASDKHQGIRKPLTPCSPHR